MDRLYHVKVLQKHAKNPFISYRTEEAENLYSYADVIENVHCLVTEFQKRQVQRGCCVIRLAEHSPASIILLLSILNYGCYFYALDVNIDAKGIKDAVRKSGAVMFATDDAEIRSQLNGNFFEVTIKQWTFYVSKLIAEDSNNVANWNNNICYVIGTSGSTGKPKTVQVPYNCIAPNVVSLCERLRIDANDVIFLCAPLTFDPFVIELFMALYCGATLIVTTSQIRLAPVKLLNILFYPANGGKGVTVLQVTPFFFRLFGAQAIRDKILDVSSSLRVLLLGGEKFPAISELCSWISEPLEIGRTKRIFNIYGITEVSCWSTIYEIKPADLMDTNGLGVPIGEPIDNVTTLRIDNLLGYAKNQGELFIGSEVRKCFISDDGGSSETLVQNIVFRRTGDLVEQGRHGEIYYIGRLNRVVKRYGKRICLDMLERDVVALLHNQPCSSLFLWKDSTQKLICCLIGADKGFDKKKISSFLMTNLEDFKRPDGIVFVEKVPLNQHGKTDHRYLLNMLHKEVTSNPAEKFRIFLTETLGVQLDKSSQLKMLSPPKKIRKNNIDSSFSELGGTSFQALGLSTEIGGLLSPVDQRTLLQMLLQTDVTIGTILNFLETADRNVSRSITRPVDAERGYFKLLWKISLDKCVDSRVTLLDEKYICIGSHSHLLLNLVATSGDVISRIELPDRIECQVEDLLSGLACVGCYDAHLYVFDYLNGQIVRKISVGGIMKAKPLKVDDALLVGSYASDTNLKCFCCKTYKTLWSLKFGNKPIYANPTKLSDGIVLVCSLDGSYGAISVSDGRLVWKEKLDSPVFSTPAVISTSNGEQQLVIAEVGGKVHICCAMQGTKICSFVADGNIFSSMMVRQWDSEIFCILFGCHDSNVYCLEYKFDESIIEKQTCSLVKLLWKVCLQSPVYAAPIIPIGQSSSVALACSTKGLLVMINLKSGQITATEQLPGEVYSSPTCLADGKVAFGCRDNFVYCFEFNVN